MEKLERTDLVNDDFDAKTRQLSREAVSLMLDELDLWNYAEVADSIKYPEVK